MKSLQKFLNRNWDLIVIFILFFFLSAPYTVDICSGYLNYLNLDSELFLLWHSTSTHNVIPYRDIFYPYGLFNYFRNYNSTFSYMYYLISPLLFMLTFLMFKKIFKEEFLLYFSMIVFYIFILFIVGFQTFSRYGVLVIFSLVLSYILYSNKKIYKKNLIYLGIILGLIFSFVNDVGVYLIFSFLFLFIFNKIFQSERLSLLSASFLTSICKEVFFVFLGFFVGIIPLFLFLLYHGNTFVFFNYFKDVKEITIVSKTPFFSFIDSPANIFTLSILSLTIVYIFFKILLKQKFALLLFFQISLIVIILIMEQKSIIRSIDRQITFISILMLMFLAYDFLRIIVQRNLNKRIIYVIFISVVVVLYSLTVENQKMDFTTLSKNIKFLSSNKCLENNVKVFFQNNSSYIRVINLLKKQNDFNGKIFSFPTENTAFYVLLKQKPPYYNASLEGAAIEKQNSIIQYIQNNKIEYITLNISKLGEQDGVPDYIRQGVLFKYILNNYYPFDKIGNHLLLKKSNNGDFFSSNLLLQVPEYRDYLLNVYLYKIPYSEGLYKHKSLESKKPLLDIDYRNKEKILLKNRSISSKNKVIVLTSSIKLASSYLNKIKLYTSDGYSTIIFFNSCKLYKPCVINLQNIPLFYKERLIGSIELDSKFEGSIDFFNQKKTDNLW